jgi:MHS family proline/betaine transporter-like MFS transporter
MNKVIASCMIGNALEWYEFTLYGYFATVIGKLFFPNSDPIASLIAAFAVFAAGFLMRPVGAIIFGHIGDKLGRKKALVISIYLMAIPTAIIGIMPTYEQIGWLASFILMVIRLLQGISMGGEFTGSMIFIIEHSPNKGRGYAGSFASLSLAIGIILGSATATTISYIFTQEQLYSWAWRIPFLLSIFGAIIGGIMRKTLEDPAVYKREKSKHHLYKLPVKELFTKHYKPLSHAICIELILAIGFYIVNIFSISYMKEFTNISDQDAIMIAMFCTIVYGVTIPFAGSLSDRIGRKNVMFPATVAFLITAYPLLSMMHNDIQGAMVGQMIGAVLLGVLFGPLPAMLVEMFPIKIRYSGLSMAHSLSMSIFGGTAPLLMTISLNNSDDVMIPAYYLMLAAIISAIALYYMRDKSKLTLSELN